MYLYNRRIPVLLVVGRFELSDCVCCRSAQAFMLCWGNNRDSQLLRRETDRGGPEVAVPTENEFFRYIELCAHTLSYYKL